jgi:hypothetical protein
LYTKKKQERKRERGKDEQNDPLAQMEGEKFEVVFVMLPTLWNNQAERLRENLEDHFVE